jgi:hypothetical protein
MIGGGPRSSLYHQGHLLPPDFRGSLGAKHGDAEVIISVQGSDGRCVDLVTYLVCDDAGLLLSTYTVSRQPLARTDDVTLPNKAKDEDEDSPLSPSSSNVSRPDEEVIDGTPATDVAAGGDKERLPDEIKTKTKLSKVSKALLADGIDAALSSERVQRLEEVWSECAPLSRLYASSMFAALIRPGCLACQRPTRSSRRRSSPTGSVGRAKVCTG